VRGDIQRVHYLRGGGGGSGLVGRRDRFGCHTLSLQQASGPSEVRPDLLPGLIRRPLPGPVSRDKLWRRALPIKIATGSPLAETVGSGGRMAHSSAADLISWGHSRTMPSARLADISSNASRASRSLSARSSPTLRRSSVDTGVRLPHQVGHGPLQIEQRLGRAGCRQPMQQQRG
jgi:hypothetical protein